MAERMKPRTIVRATAHPSEGVKPTTKQTPFVAGENEDEVDGIRTFRLIFESVTCDECQSTVPVTRTCTCRKWKPRDDEYVGRRRQAIAGLADALSSDASPTLPLDLPEAVQALTIWIDEHFAALDALGSRSVQGSRIKESVAALISLRQQAAAVPRRRPWLAVWDPYREVLGHLAQMAITQLDGAAAADPDLAQTTEAVAQSHLDAAATAIHRLSGRLDRWGIDSSIRLPASLVRVASLAYDLTGASDLIDLDARGRFRYTQITGRLDAPVGVGVGLLLDLGQADQAFDQERLYRVARIVYQRVDQNRDRLATLLDDPLWRADLLGARRVFYEAQLATETLLRELPGERRLEIDSVLRLGSRIAERVSHAIVGLILAVEPGSHLKRTSAYSAVHQAARQAGMSDLLLGFDERIRNAGAHDDYEVQDEHVLIGGRRGPAVRLHDDELVDIVLTGLESAAAIFAGLDCVLVELGHPSLGDRLGDLPVEDRIRVLLAACGVEPTRVRLTSSRVEMSGRSLASASVKPLTVLAAIAPHLPAELRKARLHLKRRDATLVIESELGSLRTFRATDGMLQKIAFLECVAKATLNGRPVFPRGHVRFMMGLLAHELIAVPHETAEPPLRELVAIAWRLKDRELAESVQAFIAAKVARQDGLSLSMGSRAALDRLAAYVGTPPGPWNDGSPPSTPSPPKAVAA